jgi:hypothetical protein
MPEELPSPTSLWKLSNMAEERLLGAREKEDLEEKGIHREVVAVEWTKVRLEA